MAVVVEPITQCLSNETRINIQPMWRVIRDFRRSQKTQRAPSQRRISVLPQQVRELLVTIVVEEVVEQAVTPIIATERRLPLNAVDRDEEAENNSMRPSKRRHLDIETPWKDQAWLKEHVKDLTPPHKSSPKQIIAPHESPAIRRSPPKRFGYEPRFEPYARSPRLRPAHIDKGIHLYRDDPLAMQFLWSEGDEEEDLSPPQKRPEEKDETAQQNSIKQEDHIDGIEQRHLTPIRFDLSKDPNSPTSDTDTDWDPANEVDPEEATKYRQFLRALPESVDDRGFKVPIGGIVSPETRAWNEQHRQDLELQEAANDQQTPSKLPRPASTRPSPTRALITQSIEPGETILSPLKNIWNTAVSFFSARNETTRAQPMFEEDRASTTPMEETPKEGTTTPDTDTTDEETEPSTTASDDETTSPATRTEADTKQESAIPVADHKSEEKVETAPAEKQFNPFETPAKQFAGLTLRETRTPAQPLRTPKATFHQSVKTDRKTRAQKLFEEREARKDAYKIVPLSKEWDAKVRNAVQTGVKDDEGYTKYNDTDLARVVPQYARAGGVRDNWLNDAVVNDYITLCVKHGNKDDRPTQVPTYAAFSSQTWQKIQGDPKSIPTRWWKRQGIQGKRALECEKIFMPVNTGMHWTLAVSSPQARNITIYNSMGFHRNQFVGETILKFMKQEVGASLVEDEWTIDARGVSPQQRNSDDCGVFSITTARQIILGKMETEPYAPDIIPVQRKRIVAELVNEGLLSAEESQGDGTGKQKERK